MKKVMIICAIIIGIIAVLVIAGILFMSGWGTNVKDFEHLKSPHITFKQDQKMIVVEVTGDPNDSGNKELSALFKMYYKLKSGNKDMKMASPRARWPKEFNTPREQWLGIWAMPIPDEITELPDIGTDVPIKIDTWKYGEVAETLHLGPYSEETATIEKLCKFIKDGGYSIISFHEEEYLKGPGMIFKGNPEKYMTIIRYRVVKK
jgi:hypothetical protein